jgi:hypothetical protein
MTLPIQIINASEQVRAFQIEHDMTRCCAQAMALFKTYTSEFDVKVISGVIKYYVEGIEYELEHIWGEYQGQIIELVPEWYKKQSKIRYYSIEQWLKVNLHPEFVDLCIKQCVGLKKAVLQLINDYDTNGIKLCMLEANQISNARFKYLREQCRKQGLVPNQQNLSIVELELLQNHYF